MVDKKFSSIRFFSTLFLFVFVLSVSLPALGAQKLTWKDCITEAKKNHPDLVSAREKVNQSTADRSVASSAFFPQVTGSVGAGTSKSPLASSRVDSYSYDFSGKQLLFDGFKTFDEVEQAAKNVDASRYNYDVTSSNVLLRLRTAFIDLLEAQEALKLAQNIATRRKQSEEMIQLSYSAGSEHRGSLYTAQANLAQAQFGILQAERNIDLAQRRLTKELGRAKWTPIEVQGDFSVTDKNISMPDFEKLSVSTPLLRALVVEKEAARWGVKSATASFFPQVYVNADAGRQSSSWPPHGREWSAGLTLSVPLFEGGNLTALASKAQSQFRQAEADERSGRDGVILTLQDTWTQFQDALGELEVEKKFLEADQERAKIAEAQYSSGLITFNDWIIIENNLVTTQKAFLAAEANTLLTEAAWFQAKGETLDAN